MKLMNQLFQPQVAVIGCGAWGQNLIRNFSELGALKALCEVHEEKVFPLIQRYGVPALSFEEILSHTGIEGVVIAAPPAQHFELAQRALTSGKHVFVEKPLTMCLSQAEELAVLSQDLNRILMVGHLLHYHPTFLKLLEIIEAGKLGPLKYIYSNRLSLGRLKKRENCLWDLAPHDLSMILALAGSEPIKVRSEVHESFVKGIIDTAIIHLDFTEELKAHTFLSWIHPFKEHRLTVVGNKGMIVFDDVQPPESKLLFYSCEIQHSTHHFELLKSVPEAIDAPADEPLKRECKHFLECMHTKKLPRTGSEEALRVMRVLEKIRVSL